MSLPLIKQILSSGQLLIHGGVLLPPRLPQVPCFNLTKTMSRPVQRFRFLNSIQGLRSHFDGSSSYGDSLSAGGGEAPCPCREGCSSPPWRQDAPVTAPAHSYPRQTPSPAARVPSTSCFCSIGDNMVWLPCELLSHVLTPGSGTSWVSCLKMNP